MKDLLTRAVDAHNTKGKLKMKTNYNYPRT